MKKSGKTLTLRGSTDSLINSETQFTGETEELIFSYSSPDQSRGWIVRDGWSWISMIDGSGGGDNRVGITQCLSTDILSTNLAGSIINLKKYLRQYSPEDNRTIAWNQQDMQRRNATNKDFVLQD